MKISQLGSLALLLLFGTGLTVAQTATPQIDAREQKQSARIRLGVRWGELTAAEAARLKGQQEKIKRDEAVAKSDGKVTPAERKKLAREQQRANRTIYRKKHNARDRK